PADVRPGQGGFTCIVTPTENITVVRRPVLGIDTACLSAKRVLRPSRKAPDNEDEADREGAAWHGFSRYSLGRTSESTAIPGMPIPRTASREAPATPPGDYTASQPADGTIPTRVERPRLTETAR